MGKMILAVNEPLIIWPGGVRDKPTGLMIPTHLKVLTILEKPFVYARRVGKRKTDVIKSSKLERSKTTIGGNLDDYFNNDGLDDYDDYQRFENTNSQGGGIDAKGDRDKAGSKGHENPLSHLPEGDCDPGRGEIECPLYQFGTGKIVPHTMLFLSDMVPP